MNIDIFNPKLEINSLEVNDDDSLEGILLLDVQRGKILLSNTKQLLPEKAQYGTCTYSAFRLIRARYGKDFPETKERKDERILSGYRKKTAIVQWDWEEEKVALEISKKQFNASSVTKDIAKKIKFDLIAPARELHKDNAKNLEFLSKREKILDEFLLSSSNDFRAYLLYF